MAKTLKQLVEQKQNIVQGRFQPEPPKKPIQPHTVVTPQITEDESLQEGRPSQRHPLEGHEYHKKSDAELVHIAKDAHKAAEAMKSHNTTAENKYRDQANDSATVRYFRQKNGMPAWYKKKYGHVNEATEQLDELSKKTLGSYVKGAYADKEVSATSASFKSGKAGDTHNTAQTSNREAKRDVGINKAMNRLTKEETLDEDQLDEIAGANMDTRAVHAHLKKRGWKLTRTGGGHDVYTHEKSTENIPVPRHKQLKAPLIMGILKTARKVSEEVVEEQMANDPFAPPNAKKTGTHTDKETRKKCIVREAIKDAQERDAKKKEKKEVTKSGKDKYEPDPELSSDIIRHE